MQGLRKSLSDIAHELKGIKNVLNSFWAEQYKNNGSTQLDPNVFTDEYISTEECARRLSVSDQTIRNWISAGKKNPTKGWKEGLHYVNVGVDSSKKAIIRIPWNALILSFSKNKEVTIADFYPKRELYQRKSLSDIVEEEHVASL